ncbi:MAG: hypothetical protein KAT01_04760 [Candidatus Aminicenantes bacterium]|nr:hypothetical protein [Candidatus Aminicenantes bacterium]
MSQRNGMSFCVNLMAILWLCSLSVSGMFAQSSPFHKDAKVPAAKISEAEASQVLVLGTVHLRSYGDDFNHDVLDRLLNVLEKYKPDLIGIESLAPIVIRDMVNSGEANSEILKEVGQRTAEFGKKTRASLNVSWFDANAKVGELLESIEVRQKSRELNQVRKELVLHFLSANDIYSALLQWSYLREAMRTNIDGLDADVLDYFSKHIQSPNENVSIGIALATRLNHQRIYAINDHRDKEDFVKVADALSKELENNEYLKSQPWKALYEELTGIQTEAYASGNLLSLYVYLNSEEYVHKDIDSQWQILFKAKLPSGLAQTRTAYWDVRNLGIAANIRRAMALHPGKKMLVVIGASHKGFLDALLAECMDVKVVQLADFVSSEND